MNKKEEKRTKLRWGAVYCLLFAVFALMIACHKTPVPDPEPEPEPQTPDTTQVDTTTIIEPPIDTVTYPDTIYLKWGWNWRLPPMDSVIFFAQKNSVKKIIMEVEPHNTAGWAPIVFHAGRDTLQKRIDVNPQKVRGAGTIYVGSFGAQMPDPTETNKSGMAAEDSAFYVQNGWEIERGYPFLKSN